MSHESLILLLDSMDKLFHVLPPDITEYNEIFFIFPTCRFFELNPCVFKVSAFSFLVITLLPNKVNYKPYPAGTDQSAKPIKPEHIRLINNMIYY